MIPVPFGCRNITTASCKLVKEREKMSYPFVDEIDEIQCEIKNWERTCEYIHEERDWDIEKQKGFVKEVITCSKPGSEHEYYNGECVVKRYLCNHHYNVVVTNLWRNTWHPNCSFPRLKTV